VEAIELAVLAGAAAVGIWLVEVVIRRTDVGAGLVLGLFLFQESMPHLQPDMMVGSISISLGDLLLVLLLTASTARLLRVERLTVPQRLLVGVIVLVAWALIRGAGPFGIPAAVNEARQFLRFLTAALYFSTMEPRRDLLDRLGRLWIIAAVALSALTLIRWAAYAAGLTEGFFRGAAGTIRVIPSDAALLIAQGALIAFPWLADKSRGWMRYLAPALLVFVVILQHRTVWVLTAAGTIYLLFRERAVAKKMLSALVIAAALFTVLMFTVFGGQDDEVSDQLAESAQSTDNFEWRVAGWVALFADSGPETPAEWLTGRPYGTGWDRVITPGGGVIPFSPHNFYVETALRVGVAGLAALVWLYVIALRGTLRKRHAFSSRDPLLSPIVLHVAVSVHILYFITYTPDTAQAMLLGVACAVASSATSDHAPTTATVAKA
jgi:hypothetical protein